jgi:hypothetical protein
MERRGGDHRAACPHTSSIVRRTTAAAARPPACPAGAHPTRPPQPRPATCPATHVAREVATLNRASHRRRNHCPAATAAPRPTSVGNRAPPSPPHPDSSSLQNGRSGGTGCRSSEGMGGFDHQNRRCLRQGRNLAELKKGGRRKGEGGGLRESPAATFLADARATRGRSGGGEERGWRRKGRRRRRVGVRPSRPQESDASEKR